MAFLVTAKKQPVRLLFTRTGNKEIAVAILTLEKDALII